MTKYDLLKAGILEHVSQSSTVATNLQGLVTYSKFVTSRVFLTDNGWQSKFFLELRKGYLSPWFLPTQIPCYSSEPLDPPEPVFMRLGEILW